MASRADIRAFAKAHRVSAEISPHHELCEHRRTQTGFDLTLLASASQRCATDPGCHENQRVHALLRELALLVLPSGWRAAAEPFDAAFHYRRETQWQPEIEVVVEMQPSDRTPLGEATASRELSEIRRRLHDVGVGEEIPAHGMPA
jgi:hypothetical protein